jgi:hypothetical protein
MVRGDECDGHVVPSTIDSSKASLKALFGSGTFEENLRQREFLQDFCGWAILFSNNFERGFILYCINLGEQYKRFFYPDASISPY